MKRHQKRITLRTIPNPTPDSNLATYRRMTVDDLRTSSHWSGSIFTGCCPTGEGAGARDLEGSPEWVGSAAGLLIAEILGNEAAGIAHSSSKPDNRIEISIILECQSVDVSMVAREQQAETETED